MTDYRPPLGDMGFVLRQVAGLDGVLALPGGAEATGEVVDAVLAEAGRLAAEVLDPMNRIGDAEGAVLENGAVRTAAGFKEAYRLFAAGGWSGLPFPEEHGGQGLPWLVNTAVAELWSAANLALEICPLLTRGAAEAILHHGTTEQREVYARRLVAGDWTGAMCLTEPQAGTDVGAARTRAVRDGDGGRYRVFGTKIYVSYGEHDLAPNIVHLVLARVEGAPAGTKGLSLFVVPKFLPDAHGEPGRRNDTRCVSLEHKLGIRASPTCVMSYGDDGGAVGFLLGEENAGMACMFTMMNNARLAVGHEGLGLAERAYQQALAYAKDRVQGRRGGRPAAIVEYPDVRRALLTMRAQVAAMRALSYWTAGLVDRSLRESDEAARRAAGERVALLTPMVKAWCTDLAQEIASAAVQVHGGMGFVEETGVAQLYRDAKILSIYEGTNGVQALDLVTRKLDMAGGELPWRLLAEMSAGIEGLPEPERLRAGIAAVERCTRHLQAAGADDRAAAATPYLRLFASTVGGWLLARGAAAAPAAGPGADWPGLAAFYLRHLLPPALALEGAVTAGAGDLDPALLAAA